jgi:hypothetical protein
MPTRIAALFGLSAQGKLGRMILFGNFFGHFAFSHGDFVKQYGRNDMGKNGIEKKASKKQ